MNKYLGFVLLAASAAGGQCPPYYVDMLQYFVMQHNGYHMAPSKAGSNDIYSVVWPGIFFWVKSPQGWPWDVKAYDGDLIYDRGTELNWTDPTDFKRFVNDLPLSPRCIRWGQPGPVIRTPAARNDFTFHHHCRQFERQNLGNVQTQITLPYWYVGGNVGVKARDLVYDYSCDGNYNCTFREIFTLGLGLGQIHWKYYKNGNLIDETIMDDFEPGETKPYLPCPNLYQ